MKKKCCIVFLILLGYSHFILAQNPDALKLIEAMTVRAANVKTIRYDALMNERIDGKMVLKTSTFKINTSPLKIFVKQSFLGIKLDALYADGWNNNQLLVATVGFPWLQLNLDPRGKRVRDNHHHTIFEAGFNYFVSVVNQIVTEHRNDIQLACTGTTITYGKKCFKVELSITNFKTTPYLISAGENLTTVAKKYYLNDYMLLEKNQDIDYYDKVNQGQVINKPNTYAKKMILYIDADLLLPQQIELFDDKGLYASYGYTNLIVNQPFAWNEFSATFKEYHFR